jgi:lipopolysaccharide transport system permease protein
MEKIITGNNKPAHIFKKLKTTWHILPTLVLRDIKTRYAQTRFGILISFLQLVIITATTTLFFGYFLKTGNKELPFIIFVFPGLMAWYYFTNIVVFSSSSLLQSKELLKKINVPKIAIPVSKAVAAIVEFFIWFVFFLIIMPFFGFFPSFKILFVPVVIILIFITGMSLSLWISVLSLRKRDFIFFVPFIIGLGVFITPVFFDISQIPERFLFLEYLNPMSFIIELLRWMVIGTQFPDKVGLLSFIPVIILLISGVLYFDHCEKLISDEI